VSPVTAAAPIEAELPLHTDELLPAFAAGVEFTVITILLLLVQPLAVTVSVNVYVVVAVGDTDGLLTVELKPDGLLDQL
jgi:hypothetical protein